VQGGIKLVLVVAGCVIAMAVFVGVSESNRRQSWRRSARLSKRKTIRSQEVWWMSEIRI
jgi:hypothetical protein